MRARASVESGIALPVSRYRRPRPVTRFQLPVTRYRLPASRILLATSALDRLDEAELTCARIFDFHIRIIDINQNVIRSQLLLGLILPLLLIAVGLIDVRERTGLKTM